MQNVHTELKGDKLIVTIDVSAKTLEGATVSNSEAAKAAKAGRQPEARLVASTGGFLACGPVKLSINAIK